VFVELRHILRFGPGEGVLDDAGPVDSGACQILPATSSTLILNPLFLG
jgi:hypothetical protein